MSDTPRTLATLLANFADNTENAITEQMMRDFVVSALGGYGGLSVTGGVTAQSIGTTAAKLSAWTATLPASNTTPSHSSDQVTIGTAGDYAVDVSLSAVGSASHSFTLQLYKNGVAVSGTKAIHAFSAAAESASISIHALLTLAAADVLTVYVVADALAQSITVSEGSFVVKRLS